MSSTNTNIGGSGISFDLPKKTPTFPIFNTEFKPFEGGYKCQFETALRIQREGLWYDFVVRSSQLLTEQELNRKEYFLIQATQRFILEVHFKISYMKVPENMQPSPSQIDEVDRMFKLDPTLQF